MMGELLVVTKISIYCIIHLKKEKTRYEDMCDSSQIFSAHICEKIEKKKEKKEWSMLERSVRS